MKLIQTEKQQEKACQILSEAYFHAENISWIFPHKDKRKMRLFFSVILNEAVTRKGAFLSDDETGVLLLYRQDSNGFSWRNLFLKMYVLLFVTGISRGWRALKHQKNITKRRPKEGWLGMGLAILESKNLSQLTFELKREAFEMTDQSGLPVYAETTVPRVKKLYEHLGFVVYDSLPHPYADLTVWFLKRD